MGKNFQQWCIEENKEYLLEEWYIPINQIPTNTFHLEQIKSIGGNVKKIIYGKLLFQTDEKEQDVLFVLDISH